MDGGKFVILQSQDEFYSKNRHDMRNYGENYGENYGGHHLPSWPRQRRSLGNS